MILSNVKPKKISFEFRLIKIIKMKNKLNISAVVFIVLFSLCWNTFSHAQTGINTKTPDASAALEIKSLSNNTGLLMPRMTKVQKEAISNPATGLMVYDLTQRCVSQNAGTTTSPNWVCLAKDINTSFFYMPSIAVDASVVGNGKTLNLYQTYKDQFSNPKKASTGAPSSISYFLNPTDLYYYITACDTSVIRLTSIDANGVLTYDIIKAADYGSFMNVVFVVK